MARTITREQLYTKLTSAEPISIIEALPAKYYEAVHIPGAVNIPHDEISAKASELLPDKNAPIVVYCSSTECKNSEIAANALSQMGYTDIYEYVEGKQHWLEAGLQVETGK